MLQWTGYLSNIKLSTKASPLRICLSNFSVVGLSKSGHVETALEY